MVSRRQAACGSSNEFKAHPHEGAPLYFAEGNEFIEQKLEAPGEQDRENLDRYVRKAEKAGSGIKDCHRQEHSKIAHPVKGKSALQETVGFSEIEKGVEQKAEGNTDIDAHEIREQKVDADFSGEENIEEAVNDRCSRSDAEIQKGLAQGFCVEYGFF